MPLITLSPCAFFDITQSQTHDHLKNSLSSSIKFFTQIVAPMNAIYFCSGKLFEQKRLQSEYFCVQTSLPKYSSKALEMPLQLILLMYVCTLQHSDRSAPSQAYHPILYLSLGIVRETNTVQAWKNQSATTLDNP